MASVKLLIANGRMNTSMKSNVILYRSAFVGLICGILSAYPFELKFLAAVIFWGVAGAIIGLFVAGQRETIQSGVLYGNFLSVGFLFSRFAVTAHVIPSLLFVALAILGTTVGGILTVFVGSKLRRKHTNGAA